MTSTGNRILGGLRSADGKGVVRIEDRFDTDIAYLAGGERCDSQARWDELEPAYQDLTATAG